MNIIDEEEYEILHNRRQYLWLTIDFCQRMSKILILLQTINYNDDDTIINNTKLIRHISING
jgi:hypothetical protein